IQAKERIAKLINKVKPDIVHLHMIDHQISPSILHSIKKHGIPVLQTAHQSKIICPNYRMYNWSKNQICEKCLGGHFYHPIIEKCHKNSRMAGLLISFEAYLHSWIKIYKNNIDLYHVPSKFMGEKFIQAGVDPEKVKHIFYTINIDDYPPRFENENYFVYYGRLEAAKGLKTLLKAMASVKKSKLLLIGTGEERENLEAFSRNLQLNNVEFLGYQAGKKLQKLVANAKFVIIPSECYDNSPLVVYESFCLGKPVIGAKIGGIPELIDHGVNGFHFEAGNYLDLAGCINSLLNNSSRTKQFGRNARRKAELQFSPEIHYNKVMKIYHSIGKKK
ncbi:MAG TPA: glycosyltransferase family 1 protein, partial [bacterium]|nr:glycosyltransferase family 1 protein [bacterium]